MKPKDCCGGEHSQESCATCGEHIFSYWCDTCKRSVPDKRCPYCGLKAGKKRQEGAR